MLSAARFAGRLGVAATVVMAAMTSPARAQAVSETFEGTPASWQVLRDVAGSGAIAQAGAPVASGVASARLATSSSGARAAIGTPLGSFSDAVASHQWEERPGTHRWQRSRLYVPSATVAALGAGGAITVARFWASGQPSVGWGLRVRQGGALSVVGTRDADGATIEFPVYATLPLDRWIELEIGLRSQHGPGVKRAFAFVVDGRFHGWFHQGRMQNETYDRAAIGLVEVTVGAALEAFVDDWGAAGTTALPTGTDLRSTAPLQEQDFRTLDGAMWQIDWSSWANDLRLDPVHGVYSDTSRLQSGRNIDRMPTLTSGWAEVEIGWPKGTPTDRTPANGAYFGPMVGFRKEINREENLEIIPIGRGGGNVALALEAWNDTPEVLAEWPLPLASISSGGAATHVPEPGDVIRARWDAVTSTTLRVRASYFDASAQQWHTDVIDGTWNIAARHGVNFTDGAHTASSITSDSPFYSIRRFRVGTAETFGEAPACLATLSPPSASVAAGGGAGEVAVVVDAGCAWIAASSSAWLTVTGAAAATGPGATAWTAAPNPSATPRTGTLAIAGASFTVSQAGAGAPPLPPPAISVGDVVVAEGGSGVVTARFPVWLSIPSAQAVSVQYASADGTAVGGSDFTPVAGTLVIPAGATSAAVDVAVLPDGVAEADESFELRLSAPVNATLLDAVGVAQIVPPGSVVFAPPSDLSILSIVGARVTLRWNAGDDQAPAGFLLAGGTSPGAVMATLPLEASHRLASFALPPGVFYIRAHAVSGATLSAASNEVRVSVGMPEPPSAPAGLVGLASGSSLALTWRTTFAGGPPANAVLDVAGPVTGSLALGAAETFTFAPVPAGVYTLSVRSTNGSGASAPSTPVTLAFPEACSGAPLTPVRLLVHRSGRFLQVLWEPAPAGAAPTGYLLQVSGAFNGVLPTSARSLGGVVGAGAYQLAVAATNACGQSAFSPVQTTVVP
jgi:hypothetical protein